MNEEEKEIWKYIFFKAYENIDCQGYVGGCSEEANQAVEQFRNMNKPRTTTNASSD